VLGEILGACQGIKILISSRVRLRITGERELPLGPLALENHSGDALTLGDAVQLFVERAQAVKPEFAVDSANLPAVAEIVRRLDGLPLAIELAAVRVRALTPGFLLQRMEPRLPLLTGGSRDLPARQQTMRDAIAWSYGLLQPQEQTPFCQLAVFAGGFTLRAAQTIRAGEEDTSDILERLAILIDHSLVNPVSASRYRFLETVREFAWERLVESGHAQGVQRKHADYFLDLAMSSTLNSGVQAPAALLDRLEAEHANLRVAFAWLLDHDIEHALRLATAVRSYWRIRGRSGEGASVLERALPGRPSSSPKQSSARTLSATTGGSAISSRTSPGSSPARGLQARRLACCEPPRRSAKPTISEERDWAMPATSKLSRRRAHVTAKHSTTPCSMRGVI
jgi:predicted ATPase